VACTIGSPAPASFAPTHDLIAALRLMQVLGVALATGFGVGYVPIAPGTFGSLLGLALWLLVPPSLLAQVAAVVVVFAIGAWSATETERRLNRTDPGPVVIDEVLGMWITMLAVPVSWSAALAGFLLFRVFDVIKPYPANRLEQLHGGVGIMADDAMAGVYANLVLRIGLVAGSSLPAFG